MFVRYRSDYANQVHQLLVSVSRHLFITSDDRVRYQKKPFTFTLDNVARSAKEHVVHYLIRDHFSGHFYAEVARSTELIDPAVFLMRAWRQKEKHSFCGAPDMITLPASVARAFPRIVEFIAMWGIEIIEPTSGCQAGVRDLQTWEQQLLVGGSLSRYRYSMRVPAEVEPVRIRVQQPDQPDRSNWP